MGLSHKIVPVKIHSPVGTYFFSVIVKVLGLGLGLSGLGFSIGKCTGKQINHGRSGRGIRE